MTDLEVPVIYNPLRLTDKIRSGSLTNSSSLQVQRADSINNGFSSAIHIDDSNDNAQQNGSKKSTEHRKQLVSSNTKKVYNGVIVTISMTAVWVGTNHFIKFISYRPQSVHILSNSFVNNTNNFTYKQEINMYKAPFFTTWFCTNWLILFFPLFILKRLLINFHLPNQVVKDTVSSLNERGYNFGYFILHCSLFCMLWTLSIYIYIYSLNVLLPTDAIALYATNMCSLYLLSWVILHDQFVGIRIMAVIICDTGIALLVYMDGITDSPTLLAVLLAALAASGLATLKVLFKKVLGDVSFDQLALIISSIGLINALLLWPVILFLYFSQLEVFQWHNIPWSTLTGAGFMFLITNLFQNFGTAITYELFVNLSLITSVPISGAKFADMNLAGIILIVIGYFFVLFPDNWPDYIIRLIRGIILITHNARHRNRNVLASARDNVDYRTGYIKSHLRSPSGREHVEQTPALNEVFD